MRLLHLNAGNLYGGIETYLVTLAKLARSESTLEHTFLLTSEGRLSSELQLLGADVRFAGPARLSRPWTLRRARQALRFTIDEVRPDMVIAHGPWPLVVFAPDRTRDGPSVVLYLHVNDSGGWLDRLAHRVSVDGIVANSNFTATVGRRGWRASPVWVCRYPVPEPPPVDRSVVREELRLAESDVAILQVSRFQEWKGQLLHLAALHRLPRELPWRAFLVGGASRPSEIELRSKVLKLASALPNGKFTLLGERSDVPRLMRAADIFCQPNTGPEPFGLVFVEALWAGVPVVTTRMGGAVEIIDDSCGRLCGADPESVAAALEALVRSADLRHSLGREGPTRAARLCSSDEALRELKATLKAVKERRTAAREMSWA